MNAHTRTLNQYLIALSAILASLACVIMLSFWTVRSTVVQAAPQNAAISGVVLKQGEPLEGKRIELVKNPSSTTEEIVEVVQTDSLGAYFLDAELDIEYELRGFGDTGNNELHEWVMRTTPSAGNPDVTLPTLDVYYAGLFAPEDGATYARTEIDAANPIRFSWSSHPDAVAYSVWLRQLNNWGNAWRIAEGTGMTAEFDGMLDGELIPALTYDWHVGISLDNGWGAWTAHHQLTITGEQTSASIEGYVLRQGVPVAGKPVAIVSGVGTPNQQTIGSTETDDQGRFAFSDLLTSVEYEINGNGESAQNELPEWNYRATATTTDPDLTLPTVDIFYDGLVAPVDGATYSVNEIGPENPIEFEWTAKDGANRYDVWLRQPDNWGNAWFVGETLGTTLTHDGMLDGLPLPPMDYAWHVSMNLDSGWWAWSEHRLLTVTVDQPGTVYLPLIAAGGETTH